MRGGHDEPLLGICGLSLGYGRRKVLDAIDLEVRAGEFWFLLGPNGSGKTTLLRAVLGLLAPRSGSIQLHASLRDRGRLGFVPQRCEINPSLSTTVREFVLLGLVGIRVSDREREERLAWALERAGMAALDDADHWSLSGGQHQRMLVARALVRRPSLLILDEPTEGLDVGAEEALLRTIAELNRDDGVTLLVVTHKLEIAARFASHVAIFDSASVASGARDEILQREQLERAFGTVPDLWGPA